MANARRKKYRKRVVELAPEPLEVAEPEVVEDEVDEERPMLDLSGFEEPISPTTGTMGDLITLDPVKVRTLREKGVDVTPSRVHVYRWVDGQGRTRLPGEYPPESVSVDFLLKKWGPGSYEWRILNLNSMFIGGGRTFVQKPPEPPKPEPVVLPRTNGNGGGHSDDDPNMRFLQQMILTQMARPQVDQDPMREAVAQMVKLIQLQMQMQSLAPKAPTTDPAVLELLKQLVAERRAPVTTEPSLAQMMPVLQFGLGIGARLAGAPGAGAITNHDDTPAWLKMVPQLADTVGVPMVLSLAQAFLPPDKAKGLLEAVESHMKARQAEAEAGDVTDEPEVTP